MNTSSSSITVKFYELVMTKIRDNLSQMFKKKQFVMYQKKIILSIKNNNLFEDVNTGKLFIDKDFETDDTEYLAHNIKSIINKVEFTQLFNENKNTMYGLNIVFEINYKSIDFVYNPEMIFIEGATEELLKECIEIYNLFNNIRIQNHNRLAFSLPGRIYNRPDREYFIVMNDDYNYNVQVYKINFKNIREKFMFGVYINVSPCGKKTMSVEPFFFKNYISNY